MIFPWFNLILYNFWGAALQDLYINVINVMCNQVFSKHFMSKLKLKGLMQTKIDCIAIECQYMNWLTLLCDHLDSNVSADLKRGWSNCFPRSCNRSHCLDIHCPQIFACRKTSNDHDEFSVCKILNLLILNLQLTNIDS